MSTPNPELMRLLDAAHDATIDIDAGVSARHLTCSPTPRRRATVTETGRSHPRCWTGSTYEHTCHQPSGRACVDCGQPAGTPWGPYWCPDCDVVRLDRVARGFATIAVQLAGRTDTPTDEETDHA